MNIIETMHYKNFGKDFTAAMLKVGEKNVRVYVAEGTVSGEDAVKAGKPQREHDAKMLGFKIPKGKQYRSA